MKRLLFCIPFLLIECHAISQNLVPNWSFEQYSQCPNAFNQIQYATGWHQSHVDNCCGYYVEYLNACGAPGFQVPSNVWGYHPASTGSAYMAQVSMDLFIANNYRENIYAQLISPLVIGETYYITMKVCKTNVSQYSSNNDGIKFSTDTTMAVNNIAAIHSATIITDTVNWTTISGCFKADSAYNYIGVGNFFDDAHTNSVLSCPSCPYNHWGYYVDDISVIPMSISGKDTISCGAGTIIKATGGTGYSWSNGATTDSIIVNPLSTTTYSVRITNPSCTIDTIIKVVVVSMPSVSLSGNNKLCLGDSTVLIASGGNSYLWSNGATTSSIIVSPSTNTTYSITVSNGGCTKDTTISVTVSSLTATITSPLTICQGDTVTLNVSGGGAYKWSTGSSSSSISVIASGTTTYSVVITNGACVKDTGVTVTVNPSPKPDITGNNQICKGDSVILTATGGGTYMWSTNQTSDSITVTPSSTSIYTVVVTNSFGCRADTIFRIQIAMPIDSIIGTSKLCLGDSITLSAIGGGLYQWSTGATTSSIEITPAKNVTYYVSNVCDDTVTKNIIVNSPQLYACCDTTIAIPGTPVILDASGTIKYYWLPSTGVSCDSCPDPIVTPTVTTTYTVIGTDSTGCKTARIITVDVASCTDIFIPNVFSPNGDGINEEFVINAQDVLGYSIAIYNRWGEKMYSSNNRGASWNGKNQNDNSLVSAGVYYYIVKYTCNNISYSKDGFVQVVR